MEPSTQKRTRYDREKNRLVIDSGQTLQTYQDRFLSNISINSKTQAILNATSIRYKEQDAENRICTTLPTNRSPTNLKPNCILATAFDRSTLFDEGNAFEKRVICFAT